LLGLTSPLNAHIKRLDSLPVLMLNTRTGSKSPSFPESPHQLKRYITRQTVFYTPSTLTVSEGDTIAGRLTCAPNERNNRDLDISITYQTKSDPSNTMFYKM